MVCLLCFLFCIYFGSNCIVEFDGGGEIQNWMLNFGVE